MSKKIYTPLDLTGITSPGDPSAGMVRMYPDTAQGHQMFIRLPDGSIQRLSNVQSDWNQTNTASDDYIKNKPSIGAQPKAVFIDQKAHDVAGGTFTAGAWRTHVINTTMYNNITGASLATDIVTLPIGTYEIGFAAIAFRVDAVLYTIRDITNDVVIARSLTGYATNANQAAQIIVSGIGQFTLTGITEIQLQGWGASTRATDGFGQAHGRGVDAGVNIYAHIELTKVG